MIIDRLGGIDPLKNLQNTQRTHAKASAVNNADSVSISEEAKQMAEMYYASEIAAQTPDVRADKVAALREKIKDPSYINTAVVNVVAERIMDAYGI